MLSELATSHGSLQLPAFFPDATRGVVRSCGAGDLEACGVQGVMVNIFHLLGKPGVGTITQHGGMHRFMGWSGPLASDSGGFQAYSLLDSSAKLGSVSNKGFVYRSEKGGDRIVLTPAKCIQTQFRLGADILFCLDYCTHPDAPAERQRLSVDQTVTWAVQCRETYDRLIEEKDMPQADRPRLFAVVQGGRDPSLRRECAEQLLAIGFDGYAYGGWPVDREGKLDEAVAQVADLTPGDRPRFALGIGKPENVVRAFELGYHLFDCVLPTRDARHQRLYVFNEPPERCVRARSDFYRCLYMLDKRHSHDPAPLEAGCDCVCCRCYSRGYLHHLFRSGDSLAQRLATMHNLRFYRRLMAALAGDDEGGARSP
jgi:queuine tRNA-ribosyltransferase